jgi:hypothetical protein
MKKLLSFLVAFVCCFSMNAQLVDVIVETFGTSTGTYPAGYTTYRVFARLQDSNDFLSSVYGIGAAPADPDHQLIVGDNVLEPGSHNIWNNSFAGLTGPDVNAGFCGFIPELCFDSYITIGRANSASPGGPINSLTTPPGAFNPTFVTNPFGTPNPVNDGAWFALAGDVNGFPTGADNRVQLLQVTCPTGTLQYQINVQVFDAGLGANSLYYCHTLEGAPGVIGGVTENDGNCIGLVYPIPASCTQIDGCTDVTACNYDATATNDDGSCTYPGCTDITACNFNAAAGCPDASCTYPGCQDPAACNFNAAAGCSDGSCTYPGCNNPAACNYDAAAGCDDGTCCFDNCVNITVTAGSFASENSWTLTNSLGGVVVSGAGAGSVDLCLADDCYVFNMFDSFGDSWNGATYTVTINGVATYTGTHPGGVSSTANVGIPGQCGCTDPAACNYNASAVVDNGSCTYPPANDVCSGAIALTSGVPQAGNNTCTPVDGANPSCGGLTQINDVWFSFVYNGGNVSIATALGTLTDTRIAVYDGCGGAQVACDDDDGPGFASLLNFTCPAGIDGALTVGNTYYVQAGGFNATTGTFTITLTQTDVTGCCDPGAPNYSACATICDNNLCIYSGCTDPGACNYAPGANTDDGSCEYTSCAGCTDPTACNYDATATIENGSCVYGPSNDLCANATALGSGNTYISTTNANACFSEGYVIPQTGCQTNNGWCTFESGETVSVWYTFTTPANEAQVTIETFNNGGGNNDTQIAVYEGGCGGTLVGANDDKIGNFMSLLVFPCGALLPNTTYTLMVDGYNGISGGFDLSISYDEVICSLGCTDPGACNYDPSALGDDGSCEYTSCAGCTNASACNYDATATIEDGSCCFENCITIDMFDSFGDSWNGAAWTIADPFGNVVATGSHGGGSSSSAFVCLGDGCWVFSVSAGSFPSENSWDVSGFDGGTFSGAGAGSAQVAAGGADCFGCTDPGACNFDGSTFDDGSCEYTSCAGCTDPTACNYDGSATIDDGSCTYPPCIANDVPGGAVALAVTPLGTCSPLFGDLTGSSNSSESSASGNDLWYSITAVTPGLRIEVVDVNPQDVAIDLLDGSLNPVDAENIVAGNGDEILNYGDLTPGATYYISVSGNTGAFSICAQWIQDSDCDYGPGPYNLCDLFKADWVLAAGYAFEFTSNTTAITYTYEKAAALQPNTFVKLSDVAGLTWGDSYDVNCLAFYNLTNGSGATEKVYINSGSVCNITINPAPTMILRPSDNCTNFGPHLLGQTIAGQPFVCGAVDYEWEFTRTDILELPFTKLRGAANRFLNLNTVTGLVAGATYSVRVRPIFSYGPGAYGAADCLSIVGPVGMTTEGPVADQMASEDKVEVDGIATAIYPNPNAGTMLNINLTGVASEIVNVDVRDQMGRLVHSAQYTVNNGSLNGIITFNKQLAGGMYTITFNADGEVRTERFVVNR